MSESQHLCQMSFNELNLIRCGSYESSFLVFFFFVECRNLLYLNTMLQVRNEILRCTSVLEQHFLKPHVSRVHEVFKPGFTTMNWTSLRIVAFASSCSKSLEKLMTVLNDVRKHIGKVEEAVNAIEGMAIFDQTDYLSFSKLSVLDFVEIAESKRQERVKSLMQRYRSVQPILLKVEIAVEESDSGASPSLNELYAYWEKRIYNALVAVVIRSLESFISLLRSPSESGCPCRIDIQIKPNMTDTYMVYSLQDIQKCMNDLVNSILESCRKFIRWMKGSCLEAPSQVVSHSGFEEMYDYSFFDDVSRNAFVKNLMIQANEEVRLTCNNNCHTSC
jgi:dynein heavy chain